MITAKDITRMVETHRDEAVDYLVKLIQTPSPTGDEAAAAALVKGWLDAEGLPVSSHEGEAGRPNVLAEWFGREAGPRFVFNGHLDVFPPSDGDPGLYGPWSGKIVDGYLYGRGSVDMKSGDTAAFMAVKLLRRMGFDPRGSVLLSYMVDEENGGGMGVKYLLKQGLLGGDFGICMEPTRMKVLVSHGGILRGTVTYRSATGHSSKRLPGADALKKSVRAIEALYAVDERLQQTDLGTFDDPVFSITVINSGTAPNVHPSQSTFFFDRRLVPGESHEAALREIVGILDGLKAADPQYDYELDITSDRPFLDIPETDPFIASLCKSYEAVMGEPTDIYRRGGGSDAANIRKATGMPIPNFGPGLDVEESGTPNEKICLEDYLNMIKVYMMVLVDTLS